MAKAASKRKPIVAAVPKRKPKNARGKRVIQARQPMLIEGAKCSLVMKGNNTSQVVNKLLQDLHTMKKPHSRKLAKRNQTRPFEDQGSVEFLCRVNDAGLFAFGSHSKKRSHNLVLGRCFDAQVLDMFEFGIDAATFKTIEEVRGSSKSVIQVGVRPAMVFIGDEFETNPVMSRFKNLMIDFFRGETMEEYNLATVSRAIVFTCCEQKVRFRHYAIQLKKSGSKTPKTVLTEVGPRVDLLFRRHVEASEEVQKAARRKPRFPKDSTGRKNVEAGKLGQTLGRVHMQRPDLSELALSKNLRKTTSTANAESSDSEQSV